MKLSKQLSKAHLAAMDLVHSDRALTQDERWSILENFHEGAGQLNGLIGAFFTPVDLALSFHAVEIEGSRSVMDLCAGVGRLGWWAHEAGVELHCVEMNQSYLAAGKRVLPNANWILGSALDLGLIGGIHVQTVISNPPFGKFSSSNPKPDEIEARNLHSAVVEMGLRHGETAAFIMPKDFADGESEQWCRKYADKLKPSCIDASFVEDQWRMAKPKVEVYSTM